VNIFILAMLATLPLSLLLIRSCLRASAGNHYFDSQLAKVIFYAAVAFDVYVTYSFLFPKADERRDGLEIIVIPIIAFIQLLATCTVMVFGQAFSELVVWLRKLSRRS
jgi:hypothetical protein